MSARSQIVLGSAGSAEDELRLPRPPGVIRRFWARHPVATDVVLVAITLLLTVLAFTLSTWDRAQAGTDDVLLVVAPVLVLAAALALLWRRRFPLTVFLVTFAPLLVLDPSISESFSGPAPLIALYSVAVYRSTRAAMWLLAGGVAAIALLTAGWMLVGALPPEGAVALVVAVTVMLLIGALIGANVGNRKRYVEALIERSRQLAIERDQQAQLAAAAERTRIAREMHDIVSHSLAVIVALAEGVRATDDVARSREASTAIADTARDALTQMRVMLGVLRTDPTETADAASTPRSSAGVPLEPLLDTSVEEVVANARAAGFPVTLTVTGTPAGSAAQRLAVLRIVQEGLTNAMRYARDPSRISVETDYARDRVRVQVSNDGVRASELSRGSGSGLQGLQERVAALGGAFSAGPSAPHAWRLTAEFPREAAGG